MSREPTDFAQLVSGFLTEYLPLQRNYSRNTVLSYKDALKLFAIFLTEEKQIRLNYFTMKQFNRQLIIDYLEWLRSRGAGATTTNQRLAAVKAFAEYAGVRSIEHLESIQSVQAIKAKKASAREITWLSVPHMTQLINLPDANTANGLRHRAVMTLLYDSGCRVQELCDLRLGNIQTGSVPTVRLHGKGNKFRTVTIADKTAKLVHEYICRQRSAVLLDQPLFINRDRKKLTRAGVNYIIQKYVQAICQTDITFPKNVHAHCFRHSKAMHMLAAGINIVYIRDFLGHEDISTTMIYSRADNRLKTEAICKLAPQLTEEIEFPDWTKDQTLLEFLSSFK